MRLRLTRLAAVTTAALLLTWSCATLQPTPDPNSQAAIREAAAGIVQNVRIAIAITRSVGTFVDTLPIADATKDEFDDLILSATGTTAAPGPLYAVIDALQGVTGAASLRTTAAVATETLAPLIAKLKADDNQALRIFGTLLEEAVSYAKRVGEGGAL